MEDADAPELPLADQLRDTQPLEEYKAEKICQLDLWREDCRASDKQEAEIRYNEARTAMQTADTTKDVDECLRRYYDWQIRQGIVTSQ
jgi:hypothetical protein